MVPQNIFYVGWSLKEHYMLLVNPHHVVETIQGCYPEVDGLIAHTKAAFQEFPYVLLHTDIHIHLVAAKLSIYFKINFICYILQHPSIFHPEKHLLRTFPRFSAKHIIIS